MTSSFGKIFIIILLTLLLIFNPLISAVLYAFPNGDMVVTYSDNGYGNQGLFAQGLIFLRNLFNINASDRTPRSNKRPDDELLVSLPSPGIMDPLLLKTGDYFSGVFEDEQFEDIVDNIFKEIENDDRITGLDVDAMLIEILRDDRLAEILGSNIASFLKNEDFLDLITWFLEEIERLLKDEKFTFFIRNAIKDFLGDERIVFILQDLVAILMKIPEDIIQKLSDDDRFGEILSDIIDLVLNPLSSMMEGLSNDERVLKAIDNIMKKLEHIPANLIDALLEDDELSKTLEELQETFKKPIIEMVENFIETVSEEEVIRNFLDNIFELLEAQESFLALLDIISDIKAEVDKLLEEIGSEVDTVIDYYGDRPRGGDDEDDPLSDILDEGEIEEQVEGLLNHWIWILTGDGNEEEYEGEEPYYPGVVSEFAEELGGSLEYYVGEDSLYIKWIVEAANNAVENSVDVFLKEIKEVFNDVVSEYPLEQILQNYTTDERLNLIIEDALGSASFETIIALVEDREELFIKVLEDIIAKLPLDMIYRSSGEEEDLSKILDDIILEIPFDAIAELLSDEEIDKIIEGFIEVINAMPFDGIVGFLRENADEIGFTVASSTLNGIADGIEFPTSPDPRREAIINNLRSEERMRSFYIDLGADPESLTPESTTASVIIGIILDIIERDDRPEKFREETEKRSQPVSEEIIDYGDQFGKGIRHYLGKIFAPTKRFFDPIRRLLAFEREDSELISNLLKSAGLTGVFKWFGGLSTELLKDSGLAGFLSGSIADFLLNYGVVEELVTFERFSTINSFLAEEPASEELKRLDAEYFAKDFIEGLEEGVSALNAMADTISPASIAATISEEISKNIPQSPISLSVRDAGMEAEDVVKEITRTLEEEIPGVRKLIDDLVIPSMGIPFDFLSDQNVQKALEEIFRGSAEPIVDIMAEILKDPRINDILRDVFEDVIFLMPQFTEELRVFLEDDRTVNALEDLFVNIITDEEMLIACGDFLGDLLSDFEFLMVLEELLRASVVEAAYGPRAYPFKTAYVKVLGIGIVPVPAEIVQTGGHNGLFHFVEVLMEWLRSQSPELSPSEFSRQYPLDYLSEERIRSLIAEPLSLFLLMTLRDFVTDENLYNLIYKSIDTLLEKDLPGFFGLFMQEDNRMSYLLSRLLANFPFDKLADILQGSGLKELAGETLGKVPLEQLIPFIDNDRNIRGVIRDISVVIDPSPMRSILPIDAAIPAVIIDRVRNFPSGILTGFFLEDNRAFNMGYTIADIQSRFAVNLLGKPELAEFQRDIILEKIAESDYGLIEDIFNGMSKVTGNELLADFLGALTGDVFDDIYQLIRNLIRSFASLLVRMIRNTFLGLFPFFLMIPLLQSSPVKLHKRGWEEK